MSNMMQRAGTLAQELTRIRRIIHSKPELGFREYQTAELVVQTLEPLGARIQSGVGYTGVIADLGKGEGCIAIRADMDALPVDELNDVPYRSQVPGVMHACGHDAHVAMALGAAMLLSDEELLGQVRFLFQPSEERPDDEGVSGAARMMEDGALEGVDLAIACHVEALSETGFIKISPGPMAATEDTFRATIRGEGCHGALPHRGRDPVFIAAQVINALNGIVSRHVNPMRAAVISIGILQAGTEVNVIPNEVSFSGTIRSFDEDVRATLHLELRRAFEVARALGGNYELSLQTDAVTMTNDPQVTEMIASAARDLLGADRVLPEEPAMGAEDFAYMTRVIPGAMFFLGTRKGEPRIFHGPYFDIDEAALPIGAAILAETARRYVQAGMTSV
jgi:amidohydrolase